jgi:DNA-binding winged helix-turn-helix (wHTH) protein
MENINMTSAIEGMSVSEMRRNMSEMRHKLHTQSEEHPFNVSSFLASGYPIWKFVHEVSLGLHEKRSSRTSRKKEKESNN